MARQFLSARRRRGGQRPRPALALRQHAYHHALDRQRRPGRLPGRRPDRLVVSEPARHAKRRPQRPERLHHRLLRALHRHGRLARLPLRARPPRPDSSRAHAHPRHRCLARRGFSGKHRGQRRLSRRLHLPLPVRVCDRLPALQRPASCPPATLHQPLLAGQESRPGPRSQGLHPARFLQHFLDFHHRLVCRPVYRDGVLPVREQRVGVPRGVGVRTAVAHIRHGRNAAHVRAEPRVEQKRRPHLRDIGHRGRGGGVRRQLVHGNGVWRAGLGLQRRVFEHPGAHGSRACAGLGRARPGLDAHPAADHPAHGSRGSAALARACHDGGARVFPDRRHDDTRGAGLLVGAAGRRPRADKRAEVFRRALRRQVHAGALLEHGNERGERGARAGEYVAG